MKEIEIEFKNLLTKEEYHNLFNHFELNNKDLIINKNYYYDDNNQSLKKANIALRIRHTNTKKEITLKIKNKLQNVEINIPLDSNVYPAVPTSLSSLPKEILDEIVKKNITIKTPMLFQKIETSRYEIKLKTGLLVIDKTLFKNNIVDYELEFEVSDYKKGKIEFKKLLDKFNITYKPSKPKIARAVEYSEINNS